MDEPNNSASRLLAIANKAMAFTTQGGTALSLWDYVFTLDSGSADKRQLGVLAAERLVWVANEVDSMQQFFAEQNLPQHLYAPAATAVLHATAPLILSMKREHVQQHFKEGVLTALVHLVYKMPDEEAVITTETLGEIQSAIEALQLALKEVGVSAEVQVLIKRYLALLQRAVDAYPIFGAKAFSDALQDASGPLSYASSVYEKSGASTSDKSVMAKARALFEKVYAVASVAQKLKTLGQAAYYGDKAFQYAIKHFPS